MPALQDDFVLEPAQIEGYRHDGFVELDDVLDSGALRRFRLAVNEAVRAEALSAEERVALGSYGQLFIQKVNLWRRHPAVRDIVLSACLANIAARLAGGPVRIWHDHALFKEPETGVRTPWHQDAHYWPHIDRHAQLSIWISLNGATTRNGCMAFIPGSQALDSIPAVDLADPRDIFEGAPHLRCVKPRVCELRPGSCTVHNGLTFHCAGSNRSAEVREAFAIIYMPAATVYDGRRHVVTDPLGLKPGDPLDGEMFPLLSTI